MTTLTIFFCGTGSNKFDDKHKNFWDGEIVSTLAAHHSGREFAEWIVVDGPGSGNLQADDLFTKTSEYGLSGTLFGKGWDENVQHALNIIKGKCDWQRKQLTEAEYNRLKAAGIPIEDVKRKAPGSGASITMATEVSRNRSCRNRSSRLSARTAIFRRVSICSAGAGVVSVAICLPMQCPGTLRSNIFR